jgi:hypothetical protein
MECGDGLRLGQFVGRPPLLRSWINGVSSFDITSIIAKQSGSGEADSLVLDLGNYAKYFPKPYMETLQAHQSFCQGPKPLGPTKTAQVSDSAKAFSMSGCQGLPGISAICLAKPGCLPSRVGEPTLQQRACRYCYEKERRGKTFSRSSFGETIVAYFICRHFRQSGLGSHSFPPALKIKRTRSGKVDSRL